MHIQFEEVIIRQRIFETKRRELIRKYYIEDKGLYIFVRDDHLDIHQIIDEILYGHFVNNYHANLDTITHALSIFSEFIDNTLINSEISVDQEQLLLEILNFGHCLEDAIRKYFDIRLEKAYSKGFVANNQIIAEQIRKGNLHIIMGAKEPFEQ